MNRKTPVSGASSAMAGSDPSALRQVLGSNLRSLVALEKSVSQVCRDLMINRTQFNRYLSGEAFPRPDVLHRICTYFGVDARILLEPLDVITPPEPVREALTYEPALQRLMQSGGLTEVGENALTSGFYLQYRQAFGDLRNVTVHLMRVRRNLQGRTEVAALHPGHIAARLGLSNSLRERRIEGLALGHLGGVSLIMVSSKNRIVNYCFYEAAWMGNPRLMHGTSMLTHRFFPDMEMSAKTILERIDGGFSDLIAAGRRCGLHPIAGQADAIRLYFNRAQ
ncbi:hypothetical protein AQS8620_01742 [Aquimixticola soesokkakensis]|uniref:HTH cro/C1-type domain-containing protein n=1 Tax=Aquimixticola soesokkakensis TaxID=1519096 RepID=A0A1Y5SM55_9RHOB|nr:helix-turn-helix transcriptional regulator [Aquimixticola soesokkakensis]SLN43890.1 hypothetical protein AQS8620_01742 [Aquimixticola soesokkakensis]